MDAVEIGLSARLEARVEIRRRARAAQYTDFGRQVGIQRSVPFHRREKTARHIRMRHLPQRMHPGIRPPRPVHYDALPTDPHEGLLQAILHCITARLALPSTERASVVGEEEAEANYFLGHSEDRRCEYYGNTCVIRLMIVEKNE